MWQPLVIRSNQVLPATPCDLDSQRSSDSKTRPLSRGCGHERPSSAAVTWTSKNPSQLQYSTPVRPWWNFNVSNIRLVKCPLHG